ncbi:MAG: ABC transporter permease [Faecalibacterium sp.]|jgi:simple sugar transport system permease protein|nr:ABC transporter permease [Faecalibacterium sp.]
MTAVINFIVAAVLMGTTLMFGTLGEILTEKAGNLNLGVEGLIYMGGAGGLVAAWLYEQSAGAGASPLVGAVLAFVSAFLVAAFGSLIYAFLTVTLRANQNVAGLALAIFGVGFGKFFGEYFRQVAGGRLVVSDALGSVFSRAVFPAFLRNIPLVGPLLFSYNFMIYLGVAIAFVLAWYLAKTRSGLSLRAVGEAPATADAAGISVTRYKYLSTCIGGGICGLGGLYFTMVSGGGNWAADAMDGKGWLAVALVIFALWKPLRAIWGSVLFGGLMILYMRATFLQIPTELYKIVPYIVTVIVLITLSIRQRRESQPPAALGNAYFREER